MIADDKDAAEWCEKGAKRERKKFARKTTIINTVDIIVKTYMFVCGGMLYMTVSCKEWALGSQPMSNTNASLAQTKNECSSFFMQENGCVCKNDSF